MSKFLVAALAVLFIVVVAAPAVTIAQVSTFESPIVAAPTSSDGTVFTSPTISEVTIVDGVAEVAISTATGDVVVWILGSGSEYVAKLKSNGSYVTGGIAVVSSGEWGKSKTVDIDDRWPADIVEIRGNDGPVSVVVARPGGWAPPEPIVYNNFVFIPLVTQ